MKAIMFKLLVAAALLATPAAAKEWRGEAGAILVSAPKVGFTLTEGGRSTVCKVGDWPINEPIAVLDCDDGSRHAMEIVNESDVKIDGRLFLFYRD